MVWGVTALIVQAFQFREVVSTALLLGLQCALSVFFLFRLGNHHALGHTMPRH
jgi:hypothetical protein